MSLVYLDENPDWEGPWRSAFDDGWEPWEPDEMEAREGACCEFCGTVENIRETPEPFAQKQCCEGCFNLLTGAEYDDPPFRCGREGNGSYPKGRGRAVASPPPDGVDG